MTESIVSQPRFIDNNTPADKSPFPATIGPKTGTLRVRKIFIARENIFGGTRYELETSNVKNGANEIIHVDPRHEPEMYKDMLALVPAIAKLDWNNTTKRNLVLARYWSVKYKYVTRAFGNGTRGAYVAIKITELPSGPEPEAAPVEPTKEPSELDKWFPREDSTAMTEQSANDALSATLSKAAQDQDELTAPVKIEAWGGFWVSIRNAAHDLLADDKVRDYVHNFYGVESVKDTGKTQQEMIIELGRHFSQVRAGKANLITTSENAPEVPQINQPAIGVQDMTTEPASAPYSSANPPIVSTLPEAPFSANFKLIDSHGIDVQFTIRAETVNEGVKRTNAAIEYLLGNGYAGTRQAYQPTNVTTLPQPPSVAASIGTLPAQTSGAGTKPVLSETIVKIEREYDKDKKFEYTGLYVNMGSAPSRFAVYKIKDGTPHCDKLKAITGIDWASAKLGTEQGASFTATYTESDKQNSAGKPYHNLVDLHGAQQQAA